MSLSTIIISVQAKLESFVRDFARVQCRLTRANQFLRTAARQNTGVSNLIEASEWFEANSNASWHRVCHRHEWQRIFCAVCNSLIIFQHLFCKKTTTYNNNMKPSVQMKTSLFCILAGVCDSFTSSVTSSLTFAPKQAKAFSTTLWGNARVYYSVYYSVSTVHGESECDGTPAFIFYESIYSSSFYTTVPLIGIHADGLSFQGCRHFRKRDWAYQE